MTVSNQLPREEYIEQEYFFRTYRERLLDNIPSQEFLKTVQQELLSTCRLSMAVDILRTEIVHSGRIGPAMKRMPHYFSAFQSFVVEQSEEDRSRFDHSAALQIMEREARYRAADVSSAGLFMFQLECISRNRLGYHSGLEAMSADEIYNSEWKQWLQYLTLQLGARDLADLVYRVSEYYHLRRVSQATEKEVPQDALVLFDEQTGRIARANIGRDLVYFFSALQRHLNYPRVPIPEKSQAERIHPVVESRLSRLEQRLKLLESEQKGGIDLSQFYGKHRFITEGDDPLP
ncbi:MAG: hypothetical protein MK102_14310 [Fuerstiella sp.]|nr:hypothetical protein [Fuerstiella sp.]